MLTAQKAQPNQLKRLFELESLLIKAAAKVGVPFRKYAEGAKLDLGLVTAPYAEAAERGFKSLIEIFSACESEGVDPFDDREFFILSMRSMGVSYPSDFLDHLKHGDLLEGYDLERRQFFRNMRFMECSGYSLFEHLTFEWTQLYSRPDFASEKMISYCDEVLWQANRTIDFDVPKHLIHEVCSPNKNIFEVQFKYLTPLFAGPQNPYGVLGSCRVEHVGRDTAQSKPLAAVPGPVL